MLTLRQNEKLFSSWFEALLVALLPAVLLFMLFTKLDFWLGVIAFVVGDLVFGFIGHSTKIISVELQRGDGLNLVTQTVVLGKTLRRTKSIGSDWTWVRVRMYYNKGDFYLVELGNWGYQCKAILLLGASDRENLVRATETSSKVAKFLGVLDKGFVPDY